MSFALGSQIYEKVAADELQQVLADTRFELIPLKNINKQLKYIPQNARVTLTCSPTKGIEATLDLCEELRAHPSQPLVEPHIAARMIQDEEHLKKILERLQKMGVKNIFMPGGDIENPAGKFSSSLEVFDVLQKTEHHLEEIGITGYPEGHPLIATETLNQALQAKKKHATHIVTQMCFDPDCIQQWVRGIREIGVDLPVYLGIPGVVGPLKLLEISMRLGIGQSVRFLKKNKGLAGNLVGGNGESAVDDLVEGLAPFFGDEKLNIQGLHIYTFNRMKNSADWWAHRSEQIKVAQLSQGQSEQ